MSHSSGLPTLPNTKAHTTSATYTTMTITSAHTGSLSTNIGLFVVVLNAVATSRTIDVDDVDDVDVDVVDEVAERMSLFLR